MNNCPNCGASITGSKCEYCGTVFDNAQERYRLTQEQENQYLRLNLIHQLDQLNSEIRSLKFKMNYDKVMAELKQNMLSYWIGQQNKKWWQT